LERAFKPFVLAVLMSAIGFASLQAQSAQVYYRWVDDNGHPVHSDRPPPKGIDYEVISTGSSFKRPVDSEEGAVPLAVVPKPSNNFEVVEKKKKEVKKNPEYCDRAKENLETLETSARVRMRNDQGEVAFIDEDERANQVTQARETIKVHCE
jgi:hypothetical protein